MQLNLSILDSEMLSDFKVKLSNHNEKVDDGIGERKFNLILIRICQNCSDLNDDL